ncbi:MAG: asparagine synthase (glutamine-hydrolyzing) [Oscillospiraceae bacterium]|jgi:asparagine synthase (glutamine-hydrolysing)|nr:asparagine synthase (glutamine-hydrolyzing) [Oscillospiraceae bacterium]
MCSIAGEIGYVHKTEVLKSMQDTLRRRGPDQDGITIQDEAALIHTRLSVVDLEGGRQPMHYEGKGEQFDIVYNGELYNTEELRQELKLAGFIFEGHSDTEVLLKAYVHWGASCVERLNGIFAFAIWEKSRHRLFLARDRIGVKPLFFTVRRKRMLFASELKALLAHPYVRHDIDIESISELMLIGPGRTPGYGIFKGIEELKPAHCGYFENGKLTLRQYWKLEDRAFGDSFAQAAEKVRHLVTDAINRQLVADVPVCTFLSGGLDSSLISSIAAQYFKSKGQELHTFSVDYLNNEQYFKASKFQPNSDRSFIARMNEYLGAVHHDVILETPALVDALYEAVDARDLPGMADVDSSLLLFCKEIKKFGTVALSGECADELFGGYPWYRDPEIRMIDGFPWAQSTAYRAQFLNDDIAAQINPKEYVYEKYKATLATADIANGISSNERRMREMVVLNMSWFMQTLLDRKDRMSMYSGLEVRVPYCDYRIAEYLYSVPWAFKDYKNTEKGLLREAMRGYLPEEVLWRKKSPYPKTHNPEYMAEVSRRLLEIISNNNAPILQIVKKEELEKLIQAENAQPWYGQLMTTPQTVAYFLQMNYWLEKYKVNIV